MFGKDSGDGGVIDLVPNGDDEVVSIHNAEDYATLLVDLVLDKGIRKQMDAFRNGFNQVFPIERLGAFSAEEVRTML